MCVVALLIFLQACTPDRTTDYVVENNANATVNIVTSTPDSIYSIASGATQTLFVVKEYKGKFRDVSDNFLFNIKAIAKDTFYFKKTINDSLWIRTADSKNTKVMYKITVNNSDF